MQRGFFATSRDPVVWVIFAVAVVVFVIALVTNSQWLFIPIVILVLVGAAVKRRDASRGQ